MLPPFIIDQIRKREEEEVREKKGRPRPHLDLPIPEDHLPPGEGAEEESDRGVVIIDLLG